MIGVEITMACLGVLVTAFTDVSGGMLPDFLVPAALVGGGMSFAAVVGLLRGPARKYFTVEGLSTSVTTDGSQGSEGGHASCSPLLPVPVRI